MLAIAYLLPLTSSHAVYNDFGGRLNVKGETHWIPDLWKRLDGWGKFALIVLPIAGFAHVVGLRRKGGVGDVIALIAASVLALTAALWCFGSLASKKASGWSMTIPVVAHMMAFSLTVCALLGAEVGEKAKPLRKAASLGALLAALLLLLPAPTVNEWGVRIEPKSLLARIHDGFRGTQEPLAADAPQSTRSLMQAINMLGALDSLITALMLAVAISGLVAIVPRRAGVVVFSMWRAWAARLLGITVVLRITYVLASYIGLSSAISSAVDDSRTPRVVDAAVLFRIRLTDALLLQLKADLATWGMVLVFGAALALAARNQDTLRNFSRHIGGWLSNADRPEAKQSAPTGLTAEQLAVELAAVDAMRIKGLLTDEEGQRIRQQLIGKLAPPPPNPVEATDAEAKPNVE